MKCLVTGAAGFAGSHIVERLLKDGHQVVALDREFNIDLNSLISDNLNEKSKLQTICADIVSINSIWQYFSGVDWVFHAAAKVVTKESVNNPMLYHRVNVDGSFNVFDASRRAGVKKIVYMASGSCYGDPVVVPTAETAEIRPQHPYALTKYLGEQCMLSLGKIYRLPVISMRMYYLYGPRIRYGSMFEKFIKQIKNGNSITIFGDGEQKTDFIYISDAVDAIVKVAMSNVSSEIFNVGSGEFHTMNEVAEELGGDSVHTPQISNDPRCVLSDISKIKKVLKWEPKVSFRDGIKFMKEYYLGQK